MKRFVRSNFFHEDESSITSSLEWKLDILRREIVELLGVVCSLSIRATSFFSIYLGHANPNENYPFFTTIKIESILPTVVIIEKLERSKCMRKADFYTVYFIIGKSKNVTSDE